MARGSRLKVWKTNPTSLLRTLASSLSLISETSLPFSQYSPPSGESRHPITFINVDLPDPEAPMIATYSPDSMVTSTPRSAWIVSLPMT